MVNVATRCKSCGTIFYFFWGGDGGRGWGPKFGSQKIYVTSIHKNIGSKLAPAWMSAAQSSKMDAGCEGQVCSSGRRCNLANLWRHHRQFTCWCREHFLMWLPWAVAIWQNHPCQILFIFWPPFFKAFFNVLSHWNVSLSRKAKLWLDSCI